MTTRADVVTAFAAEGLPLREEHTGGNCSALVHHGGDWTVAVTTGDPCAPEGDEPWPEVWAGVYRPDVWTGEAEDEDGPRTEQRGASASSVARRVALALQELRGAPR